ncbi:MAG: trehalose-phosphatase [Proteobacteria bacterium]|nr:trehalose-phosphatase [Pseudomonadota bacterium]
MTPTRWPRLPEIDAIALLLDIDGTLLDIVATPDAVRVPRDLRAALARLAAATRGACALVSGRLVADIDRIFAPLVLPAIGAHGGEMRVAPRQKLRRRGVALSAALRGDLARVASLDIGIVVEDKGYSVALHYRGALHYEQRILQAVTRIVAEHPGEALVVLPGKCVFEVKRGDVTKGEGVRELMSHAPFAGRVPVFIGDDITDETVFEVLPCFDGIGLSVGTAISGPHGSFANVAQVREWLGVLARKGSG